MWLSFGTHRRRRKKVSRKFPRLLHSVRQKSRAWTYTRRRILANLPRHRSHSAHPEFEVNQQRCSLIPPPLLPGAVNLKFLSLWPVAWPGIPFANGKGSPTVLQEPLWRHAIGQNVECRLGRILRDETNVWAQIGLPDD